MNEWVQFNCMAHTYDTPDGTKVAVELIDNARTLLDVFHITSVREKQRNEMELRKLQEQK